MENYIPTIIVLFFVGIIIYSFYFSNTAIVKRRLKKATYKQIIDFKDGETGKIVGEVECFNENIAAPLSGRSCAYFHIIIEQRVKSGKSHTWRTIVDDEVSGTFLIRDGKHHAYISDDPVRSHIVKDKNYNSGFLNDATLELEHYLNSKEIATEGWFGLNKTIRYNEGILEDGEEVAVVGKGEWKDVNELGLPEKYGRILEITATEDGAIYMSDDPSTTVKNSRKQIST